MTTLTATLGALMAILQSHPLCERTAIVETREFSLDQFYFKVRAELPHGYQFQTRVYSKKSVSSHMQKALITGITGLDGSYLVELLLSTTARKP